LDDNRIARLFLSTVIGEEIVELTFRPTEHRTDVEHREEFIERLTHDSIIVQIPHLNSRRQNDLECLLGIFDQSQKDPADAHTLSIREDDYPEKFHGVIRRLIKAISLLRRGRAVGAFPKSARARNAFCVPLHGIRRPCRGMGTPFRLSLDFVHVSGMRPSN
jgi:hypothetical protein